MARTGPQRTGSPPHLNERNTQARAGRLALSIRAESVCPFGASKKTVAIAPAGENPRECSVKGLFGQAKLAGRPTDGCTLLTGMVICL